MIPLSVKFYSPPTNVEVIFPAEPLIMLLGLLHLVAFLGTRGGLSAVRTALTKPLVLLSVLLLIVGWTTTLFSTMPWVSFKAMIIRTSYVGVFFLGPLLHRSMGVQEILRCVRLYGLSFLAVEVFALIVQTPAGFDRITALHAAFPFYQDRTLHACALVFILLASATYLYDGFRRHGLTSMVAMRALVPAVLAFGCYATFCRAAWLGLLICLVLLVFHLLRASHKLAFALLIALVMIAALVRSGKADDVSAADDSNAEHADWLDMFGSMTNLTTDASNMERMNRWLCAVRMGRVEPLTGFGPGAYQFKYIAFQRQSEITYLSWNETVDAQATLSSAWDLGHTVMIKSPDQLYYYCGGTAHSEYLLALSEMGLPGFLLVFGLTLLACWVSYRGSQRTRDPAICSILLCCLFAWLAFAVHAMFNNFLDDCKVGFLYWTTLLLIVKASEPDRTQEMDPVVFSS